MRVSLRSFSALSGSAVLALALIHCVGNDPTPASPSGDDGGSSTDGNAAGDASSSDSGGTDAGVDSGPAVTCPPTTGLAPGAIDTAYGGGVNNLPGDFFPVSATIDTHDRILIAGHAPCSPSSIVSLAVVRFTANGTLDTSFNATGFQCVALPTASSAGAVSVSAAGNIYLAGSDGHEAVARLLDNGSIDTVNFNSPNGYLETGAPNSGFGASAVQGERLYGGGKTSTSFTIVRINSIGAQDGMFPTISGTIPKVVTGIAIADGGGIAAVGSSPLTTVYVFNANTDGSDAGVFSGDFTVSGVTSTNIAVRDDGVLVGTVNPLQSVSVGLIGPSGFVGSFGTSGIATPPISAAAPTLLKTGFATQCDGKIVMVGGTADGDGGAGALKLARLGANGALDTTFGNGGTTTFTANMAPLGVFATSQGYLVVVSAAPNQTQAQLTRFSQ